MAYSIIMKRIAILAATVALGCGPASGDDDDDGDDDGSGTADDDDGTSADDDDGTDTGADTSAGPTSTDPTVDGSEEASDDGDECLFPPLDEEIVGQLFIYGAGSGYVAVDTPTSLSLAWIEFGFPMQVNACIEWSIEPIEGVTIDDLGTLRVESGVEAGTIVSVTADLEDGRRIITADIEVYVPLESEILGNWTEIQQLPCKGGDPFTPEPAILELIFADTGEFRVTWTPFEIYVDYDGTFTIDESTGALVLTVAGGNYVPPDIDGEGTATVVDGVLTLEDLWLGTAQNPVTPVACGHVFE
jgi:hypothetical protein